MEKEKEMEKHQNFQRITIMKTNGSKVTNIQLPSKGGNV
jgi:hypothetical protein